MNVAANEQQHIPIPVVVTCSFMLLLLLANYYPLIVFI